MRNIRERLISDDKAVLEQSLQFAKQRAAQEAERGKAAETRATAMLAVLSILAGFIVPFVQPLAKIDGNIRWSLLAAFLACLLFLMKGLYYAVRVLGVSKVYRLEVDTVYDLQPLSATDALKEEIAGTIWEYRKAVQPNTMKLFWLHRCQRSGLTAIVLFMLFGMFLLAADQSWVSLPLWAAGIVAAAGIVLLVASDWLAERRGIWERSRAEVPANKLTDIAPTLREKNRD